MPAIATVTPRTLTIRPKDKAPPAPQALKPRGNSASAFIVSTLAAHPDRELRIQDLHGICGDRYTVGNLSNAAHRLQASGAIVAIKDGRESWWAIPV